MASRKKSRSKKGSARKAAPALNPLGVDLPLDHSARAEGSNSGGLTIAADVFYEISLEMHPDFRAFTANGRRLPEELTSSDGTSWSPQLHLNLHAGIEERLAKNEPPGILQQAQRLESEGKIGTHQIRHILMDALASQIWQMQKKGELSFDPDGFFAEIEAGYRRLLGDA